MLTIEAGGQVSSSSGFIGDFADSTGAATVTGADSTWTGGLLLAIGQFGRGTLTIEAGGTVSDTNGSIAGQPNSVGMVSVTGPGSTWQNNSQLFVGFDGAGTLAITNGGHVSSTNTFIAGARTQRGRPLSAAPAQRGRSLVDSESARAWTKNWGRPAEPPRCLSMLVAP